MNKKKIEDILHFGKSLVGTKRGPPWQQYIDNNNDKTSEIIERAEYNDTSGAFAPHNIHLALLSSYGVIMLPFILLLFYYIIKILFSSKFDSKKIRRNNEV